MKIVLTNALLIKYFSNFVFGFFCHFSCVIIITLNFGPALQNVNKDYVLFSYFCNFVAKTAKKRKTKNGRKQIKMSGVLVGFRCGG